MARIGAGAAGLEQRRPISADSRRNRGSSRGEAAGFGGRRPDLGQQRWAEEQRGIGEASSAGRRSSAGSRRRREQQAAGTARVAACDGGGET